MLPPRFGGRASRKTLLQEKRWSASRLTDGCRRTTRAFHPQRPAAGLISIATGARYGQSTGNRARLGCAASIYTQLIDGWWPARLAKLSAHLQRPRVVPEA